MSRRPRTTRRFPVDAWVTFAKPTDDVTAALVLLAELDRDGVILGFAGGALDHGGNRATDEQRRRIARHHDRIVGLVPLLAPVKWPRPADVSRCLSRALVHGLQEQPFAWVTWTRTSPAFFWSGVQS